MITIRNDAEIGNKRGESVRCNLRLRCAHYREQSRFSCIRKTNKSDIGEQFKLEDFPTFFTVLTILRVHRRLLGRCCKMGIALPAPSAFAENLFLSVF